MPDALTIGGMQNSEGDITVWFSKKGLLIKVD